jgi:hypothetical protein
MFKKLTLLAMVVGAFAAFAIPAAASAAPELTAPAGSTVLPGTIIEGTSTNATTTETLLGTLTCKHVAVTGEITENTGSSVAAVSGGVGSTSGCEVAGGPLSIGSPEMTSLVSTETGKGTVGLKFIAAGICEFTGTVPFTYVSGTSTISLHGTISGPCGSGVFEGDFALSIAGGGGPVILD